MSTTSSTNQASNSSSKTLKSSKIEKLVFGGNGISRSGGLVTFVPFSAPGDVLDLTVTKEKKTFRFAKIKTILKKGPDRREPLCPHFQTCGGCQLQHLNYPAQIKAKQDFLTDALKIDRVTVHPSQDEWHYRSHIRLNLNKSGKGFEMGFIAIDNRTIVTPSYCPIFSSDKALFNEIKNSLKTLSNQGIKSASLRVFKQDESVILAFSSFPKLPNNAQGFSFAKGVCYKAPGQEKRFGNTTLEKRILNLPVKFSPFGFMQNNLPLSEKLYQTAIDWIGKTPKRIYDLYCGIGITSAFLAEQNHQVTGVELNKSHVPCNASFEMKYGAVEKVLPGLQEAPDVILVNPPREGLSKAVYPLLKTPMLIYISCNPSTLARDIKGLSKSYEVEKVEGFDLFPQTTHLETIALLKSKKIPSINARDFFLRS